MSTLTESTRRIPAELEGIHFYGKKDVWVYEFVADNVLCEQCRLYAEIEIWGGQQLRFTFPYHIITSSETIEVNVHPNCRCRLHRLLPI